MRKQTPAPDKKEKDVSRPLFGSFLCNDCRCPSVSLCLTRWRVSDPSSVPVSCSRSRWISPMCIWPTQRRACGSRWWNWRDPVLRKVERAVGRKQGEGKFASHAAVARLKFHILFHVSDTPPPVDTQSVLWASRVLGFISQLTKLNPSCTWGWFVIFKKCEGNHDPQLQQVEGWFIVRKRLWWSQIG